LVSKWTMLWSYRRRSNCDLASAMGGKRPLGSPISQLFFEFQNERLNGFC
jgi:hypothetical protein